MNHQIPQPSAANNPLVMKSAPNYKPIDNDMIKNAQQSGRNQLAQAQAMANRVPAAQGLMQLRNSGGKRRKHSIKSRKGKKSKTTNKRKISKTKHRRTKHRRTKHRRTKHR